jgi:hypothetical protein
MYILLNYCRLRLTNDRPRSLIREGAPQKQDSNLRTESNIRPQVPYRLQSKFNARGILVPPRRRWRSRRDLEVLPHFQIRSLFSSFHTKRSSHGRHDNLGGMSHPGAAALKRESARPRAVPGVCSVVQYQLQIASGQSEAAERLQSASPAPSLRMHRKGELPN